MFIPIPISFYPMKLEWLISIMVDLSEATTQALYEWIQQQKQKCFMSAFTDITIIIATRRFFRCHIFIDEQFYDLMLTVYCSYVYVVMCVVCDYFSIVWTFFCYNFQCFCRCLKYAQFTQWYWTDWELRRKLEHAVTCSSPHSFT